MTYRELAKLIINLPSDCLDLPVVVFDIDCDEFRKVLEFDTVENQVLANKDHPVLMI